MRAILFDARQRIEFRAATNFLASIGDRCKD